MHPTYQIQLQDDQYQLQNENEIMTETNMKLKGRWF